MLVGDPNAPINVWFNAHGATIMTVEVVGIGVLGMSAMIADRRETVRELNERTRISRREFTNRKHSRIIIGGEPLVPSPRALGGRGFFALASGKLGYESGYRLRDVQVALFSRSGPSGERRIRPAVGLWWGDFFKVFAMRQFRLRMNSSSRNLFSISRDVRCARPDPLNPQPISP